MALLALNTVLSVEITPNSGVFTAIAEVTGIDASGITVDSEEVTSLNSGDFKEYAPGYNDAGNLSIDLLFSYASYKVFYDSVIGKKILKYKIIFPDETIFNVQGFIISLPIGSSVGEVLKLSVTIKLTGLFAAVVLSTISIQAFTNIAQTTATGNANLLTIGSSTVTEKGFCRKANTAGDPTTADTKLVVTGGSVGAFTGAFTGLSASTSYKVRAYVTDGNGTVYSETILLTTAEALVIETLAVVDIEYGTPSCNTLFRFNIVSAGGLAIGATSWGISWGTTASANSFEDIGADYTTLGEKTRYVTNNVPPNTLIYYKAKATNIDGTFYGEVLSFTTPSS